MKELRVYLMAGILTVANLAGASEVFVRGNSRAYHEYGAGQTIVTSAFEVTYSNKNLPWGVRVDLVSGYRCTNEGSWTDQDDPKEMQAVAEYTWQARFSKPTGNRYVGLCRNLEFVFEITFPDGSKYYDNGLRAPMGFYSASIPYGSANSSTLESMLVRALSSAQDYRD